MNGSSESTLSKTSVSSPEVEILVETSVKSTESSAKVVDAVKKLFSTDGEISVEPDRVVYFSNNIESLRYLKDQFRDRRVRSSARKLLLSNQGGEDSLQTYVLLNKQAATVGIGALCDDPSESALGPIVVRLRSNNLIATIDWLTAGYDGAGTS